MNIRENYKWYNYRFFKKRAFVYDYMNVILIPVRKKVTDKIKEKNNKILDVACGSGNQSINFAKKGFEVMGIDLSPDMLKYARKKIKPDYKIKFINSDASKIGYKDNFFDVSSMSFGLHDMPEEIGLMILKEMIRTTKKNGQIIIVDYDTPKNMIISWLGFRIAKLWESKYYDYFMKKELNYYLKKVNLKIISKERYFFDNIQVVECINYK